MKAEGDEDEAEAPKSAAKKARGRKAAPKEEIADEDDDVEEEEAPKPKRGKKAAANAEVKAPQKR